MPKLHTIADYQKHYQREIEGAKQHIAYCEKQLKLLKAFVADAKADFPANDKYADWKLTPAVLDAVKSITNAGSANPDGVEAVDIHAYLVEYGFPVTDNFAVALRVTLKRLSEKDDGRLVVKRDEQWKKYYKLNEKFPGTDAEAGRP